LFEAPTVAQLSMGLSKESPVRPPLVRQPRPDRVPLSYAQQRLWFIDRFEETSTEYNIPVALRLRGELSANAVVRTVNTIVERHESLRTHFTDIEGVPVQVIQPRRRIEVPVDDLSTLDDEAQQQSVAAALKREWELPFDLSRGPVLRTRLLKLSDRD